MNVVRTGTKPFDQTFLTEHSLSLVPSQVLQRHENTGALGAGELAG